MRSEESVASTGRECKLPGGFSQLTQGSRQNDPRGRHSHSTLPRNDFQIIFLGTGTSQGVPMIACDCPVCSSTDPRDNRTRSSIFITTPEAAFVVDTGPDFRTQCLRERVRWLDAVVYTHAHTDHIMGFDDLRRFCDLQPEHKLPIYASPETMADLQRVFRFAFDGTARFPGYIQPGAASRGRAVPHRRDGDHAAAGAARAHQGQRLPVRARRAAAVRLPERLQGGAGSGAGADRRGGGAHRSTPCATGRIPTHMSLDEALEVAAAVGPRGKRG